MSKQKSQYDISNDIKTFRIANELSETKCAGTLRVSLIEYIHIESTDTNISVDTYLEIFNQLKESVLA